MKTDDFKFNIENLQNKETALLFIDWFILLAKNDFPEIKLADHSEEWWNLNTSKKETIKVSFLKNISLEIQCSEAILENIQKISSFAINNINNKTPIPGSWWTIYFTSDSQSINQHSSLHMLRNLGTYKRGPNKLRMANSILLEINDETPAFSGYPKLNIDVFVNCPGACHGPYSNHNMKMATPIIGAILSSCFGTPLTPTTSFFSVEEEKANLVIAAIEDNETMELCFHDLPIMTLLENLQKSGAEELATRLIRSMMAYESGMLQRTDHATILFFISAIEALTVPNLESAQKQRVSKRFSYFLEEFCTDDIKNVMDHKNFIQAFGNIKSIKKFVNELYDLRSKPAHTGHFGNYSGPLGVNESLKVALINDIVESAIKTQLRQPVTLLWGHPELDPLITINLTPNDHQKLIKKAKNHRKTTSDYIKYLISKNLSSP